VPGNSYAFVSCWELSAEQQAVWDALVDFQQWPVWWPALQNAVETIEGDPSGIGQSATASWKGPVGYSLNMTLTAVERNEPVYLRGEATGDVVGEGSWILETKPDGWTRVEFNWNVRANLKWMEAVAPLARSIFVSAHHHVVRKGAQGLATYLDAEIRDFDASVD
jgi:uncharacterized protein YndB with AHSA1/START domain